MRYVEVCVCLGLRDSKKFILTIDLYIRTEQNYIFYTPKSRGVKNKMDSELCANVNVKSISAEQQEQLASGTKKDKGLGRLLFFLIVVPILLCILMILAAAMYSVKTVTYSSLSAALSAFYKASVIERLRSY